MSSDLDIYREQEWDYPRERLYRTKREIFQDAEVSLIDTLYHELKAKLVALGLDKAVLDGLHYQDKYHDDEATLASLLILSGH